MPIIRNSHLIYTVQPGDTLYSIANKLGSTIPLIEQSNALYPPITDPGLIYPGQVLIVSKLGGHQVKQIVAPGDSLYRYAQRYSTNPDSLQGINPQLGDPTFVYVNQALLVPAFVYEVAQRDTLTKIANRFGLSLTALLEANRERPGLSPDVIYPGFRLIIPLPSSANIVVFRPLPSTTLREGQRLRGFARAFEGTVLYRIIDDNDQVVTKEKSMQASAGGPAFGSFSTSINFDRSPSTTEGEIWVYTRSARDGSIQDLVQVKALFE
ncbi:LysM peptidoglycan-binding domain-containing protein [Halobacillus seohaensis]|uniref:LysM peptidoglycan-binding domain-containing protein n=1 Tax=Halobacillus seohaensis TaxID=447421 RepID=A0ABW2ES16_9BACI